MIGKTKCLTSDGLANSEQANALISVVMTSPTGNSMAFELFEAASWIRIHRKPLE